MELNGQNNEEPVIKTTKKIPNQKFAELSGNNIFEEDAPPPSAEKSLSSAKLREVAENTAVSLAKCSKNFHSLDLSFCRNMSNEDLGLIVDSFSSLGVLKLFGCSQVRDVFLCGHTNPHVQIIGLKMTSVDQHLKDPVLPLGSPCY